MISTLKRLQDKKAAQEIDGGFTLIELLIVIVVLGILAAVVVFSLGSVTGKSAVSACQADGATVNTAMAAYNANNGSYPTSTDELLGSSAGGPYLQSWPNNTGHYVFALTSTASAAVGTKGASGYIPAYAAGTLFVKASTSSSVPTTLTGAGATGAAYATAGWTAWAGSTSCGSGGANIQ